MKKPETLSQNESERVLIHLRGDEIERKKGWKHRRNYCLAVIMLDSGLRVGEVCKLRICDLIFQGQPVNVIDCRSGIAEKGCNRIVPVSNRIKEALDDMNRRLWAGFGDTTELYAFYDRDPWRHITERQIQRIMYEAGKASINRNINPHIFRHTFATRLMRITNIRVVQQLLGHKHIASTQVYTHPAADDLTAAINALDQFSPGQK